MKSIIISSQNYNGKTVNVVFYSINNPSVGINLGTFTVPFTRSGEDLYGTYEITISEYNKVCQYVVNPNVSGLLSLSDDFIITVNKKIIHTI